MRRNWPFFKDSDWLILVFVHSAKPTAEIQNLAMSPSLSSPGLSYDTKFVHIGWELRSSLVGDTILGVQSEPACNVGLIWISRVHLGKILHNTSEVYYNMTTAV